MDGADARERHEKVAAWKTLPDFASVNFNEDGAIALAEMLLAKGIGVEAGMGSVLATEKFLQSKLAGRCRWVLLEPEQQEMEPALAVIAKIEEMLRDAGIALPSHFAWSRPHGVGPDRCGGATRIRHADRFGGYTCFAGWHAGARKCGVGRGSG